MRFVALLCIGTVGWAAWADRKASAFADSLQRERAFVDELCACPDDACATAVEKKRDELAPKMTTRVKKPGPTAAEREEMRELWTKEHTCLERLRPGSSGATAQRIKTVEAKMQLKALAKGAADSYLALAKMKRTPHFPTAATTVTAPSLGACCQGERRRCEPDASLWTAPVWKALGFAMTDPHWYAYSFTSSGEGAKATFTATANGDLDCNGKYSTYEIHGSVGADRKPVIGEIVVTDGLE